MRIARVFVWSGDRPDDRDEIRSPTIPPVTTHEGAHFRLRSWDIRFPQGEERITDAFYDQMDEPELRHVAESHVA